MNSPIFFKLCENGEISYNFKTNKVIVYVKITCEEPCFIFLNYFPIQIFLSTCFVGKKLEKVENFKCQ